MNVFHERRSSPDLDNILSPHLSFFLKTQTNNSFSLHLLVWPFWTPVNTFDFWCRTSFHTNQLTFHQRPVSSPCTPPFHLQQSPCPSLTTTSPSLWCLSMSCSEMKKTMTRIQLFTPYVDFEWAVCCVFRWFQSSVPLVLSIMVFSWSCKWNCTLFKNYTRVDVFVLSCIVNLPSVGIGTLLLYSESPGQLFILYFWLQCLFYKCYTREQDSKLWESLHSRSFSKWQGLTLEWRKLKWYDFARRARCTEAENGLLVLSHSFCTPWTLK